MSVAETPCPRCGKLGLTEPDAQGQVRCPACGGMFRIRSAAELPAGVKPRAPEQALGTAGPSSQAAAPSQTALPIPGTPSYIFLKVSAWGIFGLAVAGVAREFAVSMAGATLGLSFYAPAVVSALLMGCLLLLVLAVIRHISRLDRATGWIAWRGGGYRQPLGRPPRSSLPYILPLCATGGLVVVMSVGAMVAWTELGRTTVPGLSAWLGLAGGATLFLMGLGCEELRLFLWRMEQWALCIRDRTRGQELSLGAPRRMAAAIFPSRAPASALVAVVLGSVAYVAYLVDLLYLPFGLGRLGGLLSEFLLEEIRDAFRGWGPETPYGEPSPAFGALMIRHLPALGIAYTCYRLTRDWSHAYQHWQEAGRSSVSLPADRLMARWSSGLLWLAWIAAGVLLSSAFASLLADWARSWRPWGSLASLSMSGVGASSLLWLGFLSRDTQRLVACASALSGLRKPNVAGDRLTAVTALAVFVAAALAVIGSLIFAVMLCIWPLARIIRHRAHGEHRARTLQTT